MSEMPEVAPSPNILFRASLRCEECNTPFVVRRCDVDVRHYCSSHCAAMARSRARTQTLAKSWRTGPQAVVCDHCKTTFRRPVWKQKGNHAFCSMVCRNLNRSWQPRGEASGAWNGGRIVHEGRPLVRVDYDHPRRQLRGYVFEHILIVERVLGHHLPHRAVVHHVNGDRADNRTSNLVICENQAFHKLIHARSRIVHAGGRPGREKICSTCHQLKPSGEFDRVRQKWDGRRESCIACRRMNRLRRYYAGRS